MQCANDNDVVIMIPRQLHEDIAKASASCRQ
jgi:hypothetical protein